MKHTESILTALRTEVIHLASNIHGITPYGHSELEAAIDKVLPRWLVRHEAENEPSFKQLIPYCVIRKRDKFLTYARAKGSGEERLLGNRSVGFGGHVDEDEEVEDTTNSGLIGYAAARELEEEIGLQDKDVLKAFAAGVINNDKDEVGKVHLGILIQFEVADSWEPTQLEAGVADLKWQTIDELFETSESYEVWSQMIISHTERMLVSKR
tara:strand:+ start:11515 stop:12147 length:633 start_codon:yes stop_codon:yes gene_type:complete